ncbi:MAG: PaaI family thioesterase [Acidobacteriota bacterium]|nr:PaaI family thioesterase [Acidobacteriota bacterium]
MTHSDPATLAEQLLTHSRGVAFFDLIGLEILEAEPGRSVARVHMQPELANPVGLMHGGIIASLIDTGIAYALLLQEDVQDALHAGRSLVTVDLRVKYLRPVSAGSITCESRVVRMGRQIIHADAIVTNDAGKEVARGDAIYTTAQPGPNQPEPGGFGL